MFFLLFYYATYSYVDPIFLQLMLLVLGLNAAHSNYACIWCKIHKDERYVHTRSP